MIGLCFQEAYLKGTEMVNEGKITGFNLGMNFGESERKVYFGPTYILFQELMVTQQVDPKE